MKLPIASHSFLQVFRRCRYQAYRKYILKDLPPYVQSEAAKKGDEIHQALEHRVGSKIPLSEEFKQFEPFAAPFDVFEDKWTEAKFGINAEMAPVRFFDNHNVYMRGKVDVLAFSPDLTTALISDWKSGKKWEDPTELEEHALLAKATLSRNLKYHTVTRFVGFFIWLKTGETGKVYDLSDTDKTWRAVKKTMSEVEQSMKADAWPAIQNNLCPWCEIKDCRFHPERS